MSATAAVNADANLQGIMKAAVRPTVDAMNANGVRPGSGCR
jgi:hypothetical protein